MQVILDGIITGLPIALLAAAFQLVYLPTRVMFIGIAGLYTLTPYAYLASEQATGSSLFGAVGCAVVIVGAGLLLEALNHAPLTRKGASNGAHMISSLGTYILLAQLVAITAGNEIMTLRLGADEPVQILGTIATRMQILISAVSAAILLGLVTLLYMSDLGLRLRALASNPAQFALYGFNVDRYRLIAFGLASLLTIPASLFTAYDVGFEPSSGLPATLLAIVAVIVGGRSSFIGPIAGGLLLGLVRSEVIWYSSARWPEAITFAVLAIFLLFRPSGIFGGRGRIEAPI